MGENCLSIMQKRVFDKLGFGKINWLTSPEGHNTGGWGMYLTADQISTLAQLLLQKGNWKGEQLVPQWWIEEMGQSRVVIPGDEKKALTHYAYHIKAGKEIFAAEGAFGQYLVCFRELPVAIGITAGAREYLAADICLKYEGSSFHTLPGRKTGRRREISGSKNKKPFSATAGRQTENCGKRTQWII